MSDPRSHRTMMVLLEPQPDASAGGSAAQGDAQAGLPDLDERVEMFIAAVHGSQHVLTPQARAAARAHILAAMASDLAEHSLGSTPIASDAANAAPQVAARAAAAEVGIPAKLAAAIRQSMVTAREAFGMRGARMAAVPLVVLLAVGTLWTSRSTNFGRAPEQTTSRLSGENTEVAPVPSQPITRSLAPSPEAEEALRHRIFSAESALGPSHPDVAGMMVSLASLYRSQGRHVEAEALYERALAIRERALGPKHPDVAATLNQLAEVYRIRGRTREAQDLADRAAAVSEP